MFKFDGIFRVKWKLLYVIIWGQRGSDNINQMITISNPLLIQSARLVVVWDKNLYFGRLCKTHIQIWEENLLILDRTKIVLIVTLNNLLGYLEPIHLVKFDHINQMITLSVITFSSLHCKTFVYKQKYSFQINQNLFWIWFLNKLYF